MNVVDEAKLRSPIRSASEALVMRRGSGTVVGKDCAPLPTNACCRRAVFSASHWFTERTSQM